MKNGLGDVIVANHRVRDRGNPKQERVNYEFAVGKLTFKTIEEANRIGYTCTYS